MLGRALFVVDVTGCGTSWRRVARRRPSGLGHAQAVCMEQTKTDAGVMT